MGTFSSCCWKVICLKVKDKGRAFCWRHSRMVSRWTISCAMILGPSTETKLYLEQSLKQPDRGEHFQTRDSPETAVK